MSIEIKSWEDGRVLYTAKNAQDVRQAVEEAAREKADLRFADLRFANLGYANLGSADLRSANLRFANLRFANLRFANLGYANLGSADLRSANLRFADLGYANLGSANLRFAEGLAPERVNDLLLLLDQVGPIRAYKLVDRQYRSPIQTGNKLTYEIGSTVEAEADPDPNRQCAAGVNVATLPWCLANWREGFRVLVVEFTRADIAAIPVGDGKFRVHRARVVREVEPGQVREWLGLTDQEEGDRG